MPMTTRNYCSPKKFQCPKCKRILEIAHDERLFDLKFQYCDCTVKQGKGGKGMNAYIWTHATRMNRLRD